MDKFNNSLTALDNIITKLQTNTGGEVSQPVQQNIVNQNQPVEQPVQSVQQVVAAQPPKVEEPQTNEQANKDKGKKKEQKKEKKQKPEKTEKKVETPEQKKQAKEEVKKEKKAEKKTEKADKKQEKEQKTQAKEDAEATVQDFSKIDIRIGEIVECWNHPQSEKLYCERIKVCGQVRQIASGLQQYIPIDDMKGPVIVMVNLKPRPLAKFMSNGMVVTASNIQHTNFKLIRPIGQNSDRVFLQGYQELFKTEGIAPLAQLNPKKKILEKCLEHFKTDANGIVTWKGIKAKTSGGYLRSQIQNGRVS